MFCAFQIAIFVEKDCFILVPMKLHLFSLVFLQSKRAELINQSRALKNEGRQYKSIFDEKKKEMEPLQQALGKLRNSNNAGRVGICSTENELNDLVCF